MLPENCTRRPRSYWTTCACTDCTRERLRKHKLYNAGRPYRVPSDFAWKILAEKIDAGWTALALASATGLSDNLFGDHVTRYRRAGERRHLSPATAAAIVRMGRPTKGQVGAEPFRRRVHALAAIGWSLEALAQESGVGFSTLGMISSRNERVSAKIANVIADTYDRLHMKPGPNSAVAKEARRKGWLPPLAWIDIDDPDERPDLTATDDLPDPVVVERILAGDYRLKATPAERAEVIARWTRSLNELERLTGWNVSRDRRGMEAA